MTLDRGERSVATVVPLIPAWRMDRGFDYLVPDRLALKLQVGCLVRVPLSGKNVRAVVTRVASGEPDRRLEEVGALVMAQPVAPPPLDGLVEWIARRYAVPLAVAYARMVPRRVRLRTPEPSALGHRPGPVRLTSYERGGELLQAISSGGEGVWCLRPVPGEDRAALIGELVAEAGRGDPRGSVVIAVPELRDGSMVLDALAERFPCLARLDSVQPAADRARSWMLLAAGNALGGGGRSSVLAPAPRLRLVVLDEEHHPTYKEDRSPRYDARRVAVERARRQHAVCVFVSATPSLEAGWAVSSGRWRGVDPQRSACRRARPLVEVVAKQAHRAITAELHDRIRRTLRKGGKVALLVPTGGYARALWCAACRRSVRCSRCESGVSYERSEGAADGSGEVRCHQCGRRAPAPSQCPSCKAGALRYMGAGSHRIAEQISRAFPRAVVRRMDAGAATDATGRARSEDLDIYVTTWFGTKASIRPRVGLVGVLDADALIRRPDFRAAEHAYHALAAMAEWAGPAGDQGHLVIQSSEPGHHAIQAIARADYRFFLERELDERRELGYPPFSELLKVRAFGPQAEDLIQRAAAVCRAAGGKVLGPVSTRDAWVTSKPRTRGTGSAGPQNERGAGSAGPQNERGTGSAGPQLQTGVEVLVKCAEAGDVAERLRDLLADVPAGSRLRVDVDPR